MVDVMVVNDWTGGSSMRPRNYYDMLFSFDSVNIDRMPINSRYWSADLQAVFSDIGRSQRQTKEPLKPFGTTGRGRRPGLDLDGYEGYDDMMLYPDMMYDGYSGG